MNGKMRRRTVGATALAASVVALGKACGVSLSTLFSGLSLSYYDVSRKAMAKDCDPVSITAWIFMARLPIFFGWALWTGGRVSLSMDFLWPSLGGITANVIAAIAYSMSMKKADISTTIPMLSLTPVFSAIAGVLFAKQILNITQCFGILAIVASTVAMFRASGKSAKKDPASSNVSRRSEIQGLLHMGLAGLGFATVVFFDQIALQYNSLPVHGFIQALGAGAVLLGISRLQGRPSSIPGIRKHPLAFTFSAFTLFISHATQFFSVTRSYMGLFEAVKRATNVLSSVVLGKIFFREQLTLPKVLAGAGLLGGMFLVLWK